MVVTEDSTKMISGCSSNAVSGANYRCGSNARGGANSIGSKAISGANCRCGFNTTGGTCSGDNTMKSVGGDTSVVGGTNSSED